MPKNEEPKPQYRWVLTWPGEAEHDFIGFDGDQLVGRIYRVDHSPLNGRWKWQVGRIPGVRENVMPHSGWADTARQAAAKTEQNFGQTMERNAAYSGAPK
ncbi:hypothetical protein ABIE33_003026 [Ensifer sp. 4252]